MTRTEEMKKSQVERHSRETKRSMHGETTFCQTHDDTWMKMIKETPVATLQAMWCMRIRMECVLMCEKTRGVRVFCSHVRLTVPVRTSRQFILASFPWAWFVRSLQSSQVVL